MVPVFLSKHLYPGRWGRWGPIEENAVEGASAVIQTGCDSFESQGKVWMAVARSSASCLLGPSGEPRPVLAESRRLCSLPSEGA